MFTKVKISLATLFLGLFSLQGFAISPGAGQAQIRNNMQTMEQNKQQVRKMQQNTQVLPTIPKNKPPRPAIRVQQ